MEVITKKDIEALLRGGSRSLTISINTVITSIAMDLINKNGIILDYGDAKPENFRENNKRFKSEKNDLPPDLILSMYYSMLKIRLFEEHAKFSKENQIIPGDFVHLYLGEEAIAVGTCQALNKNDYITSTHRGHGHLIAKGADIKKMFAELLGKETGYCGGKGGSMHITDIDIGILGANGIVGAGLPIACGSALASKFDNDRSVTVSFFGDGATNQGTFGESLNFAKIFSLPVIFICENNSYAISTPISYGCSSPELSKRGQGYDIESVSINGDDVFEVYAAVNHYIDKIRKNPGPIFIEARTHRHVGHWVGDPQNYRSRKEMEDLPVHDPLKIFLDKIEDRDDIEDSRLQEIEKKVASEIKEAVIFADKSPYPPAQQSDKDYLKE
ncbi:MAG: thiamine pyrophosphate-dependent dehydrogenase E1 component subunit alpha [Candidatus Humimicrobiaceae bacterium]